MNQMSPSGKHSQRILETAVKFVVLGFGGFLIFMFCCLALIVELSYGEPLLINPLHALLLALVGALMMLAGTGQWGRWAYLWVFLSVPGMGVAWALLEPFLPMNSSGRRFSNAQLFGATVFAIPMVVSFICVRLYYQLRDKRKMDPLDAPPESEVSH